jgi:hypothetical protein
VDRQERDLQACELGRDERARLDLARPELEVADGDAIEDLEELLGFEALRRDDERRELREIGDLGERIVVGDPPAAVPPPTAVSTPPGRDTRMSPNPPSTRRTVCPTSPGGIDAAGISLRISSYISSGRAAGQRGDRAERRVLEHADASTPSRTRDEPPNPS